jgi:hypothetical protein
MLNVRVGPRLWGGGWGVVRYVQMNRSTLVSIGDTVCSVHAGDILCRDAQRNVVFNETIFHGTAKACLLLPRFTFAVHERQIYPCIAAVVHDSMSEYELMNLIYLDRYEDFKIALDRGAELTPRVAEESAKKGIKFVRACVERGCLLNGWATAAASDVETLRYLLSIGTEADYTALTAAVRRGDIESLKLLHAVQIPHNPETLMAEACKAGNLQIVKFCLAIGAEMKEAWTFLASFHNHKQVLRFLLLHNCPFYDDPDVEFQKKCVRWSMLCIVNFWFRFSVESSCAPGGRNRQKDLADFESFVATEG